MRWWTYQRERFPLFQNGLLVLAFGSCAVAYTSLLTQTDISWLAILVAFCVCLLFFLQLRIADEFKDAEEDAQYQPYRPVPRGLIKLRELGYLFVIAAALQLIISWFYSPWLVIVLIIAWVYLALMSVEFFARDWLKARPITYLWTHMLIMPLVDLFATACHWVPIRVHPGYGLAIFLITSFSNGLVIELGRKLRQPDGEQEGVSTYSKLWGLKNASSIWMGCIITTAIFGSIAAYFIGFLIPFVLMLTPVAIWAGYSVKKHPEIASERFELISAIWTLVLYLGLGLIPLFIK